MNRHGDLRSLTHSDRTAITETITYTPFGEIIARWGTDPDPELGFQGQYTDPTTGDVLMQARWYTPGTATFRRRDTYAGNLNTPVTLNRYTYANNNPVRYSDPRGLCAIEVFDYCVDNIAIGGQAEWLGTTRLAPGTNTEYIPPSNVYPKENYTPTEQKTPPQARPRTSLIYGQQSVRRSPRVVVVRCLGLRSRVTSRP